MKINIWHNIMWSRYKAAVFSALSTICDERRVGLHVFQISETASQRTGLSPTDTSWHKYSHELLFEGSYEKIPRLSLFWEVAKRTWKDDAEVTILAGYDRPEYWIQAIILLARRKPFACFCDSTVYDNKQKFFVGLLKALFFRWTSAIFCYGQRAAEYVQLYGATPDKIIHRCQAAALYEGYTPELALKRRRAMNNRATPANFLFVGRLSPEKSIDHLIVAFDRVRNKLPDSKLILVGSGPDEARLRGICDRLGTKVEFRGPKQNGELFDCYLEATCLVLPSHSEPWGLVVNEALSHGCPVIVSNRCGCVPELVRDGIDGYVFEWGNTEDLAQKMLEIAQASDPAAIAHACLETIAPYTSENAARSIYEGSLRLAANNSGNFR